MLVTCNSCKLCDTEECIYKRQGMNEVIETKQGFRELRMKAHHCMNHRKIEINNNILPQIKSVRL